MTLTKEKRVKRVLRRKACPNYAEDARKANADATKRFFDEIEKAAATIR